MEDNSQRETDGGGYPGNPFVETRERLTRVEEGQNALIESVDRIEEKVDETHELVHEVDDRALSKTRFENDFAESIEDWKKYLFVAKWLGGTIILLAALLQVLVYFGVGSI